jgi:hypothetical protein
MSDRAPKRQRTNPLPRKTETKTLFDFFSKPVPNKSRTFETLRKQNPSNNSPAKSNDDSIDVESTFGASTDFDNTKYAAEVPSDKPPGRKKKHSADRNEYISNERQHHVEPNEIRYPAFPGEDTSTLDVRENDFAELELSDDYFREEAFSDTDFTTLEFLDENIDEEGFEERDHRFDAIVGAEDDIDGPKEAKKNPVSIPNPVSADDLRCPFCNFSFKGLSEDVDAPLHYPNS